MTRKKEAKQIFKQKAIMANNDCFDEDCASLSNSDGEEEENENVEMYQLRIKGNKKAYYDLDMKEENRLRETLSTSSNDNIVLCLKKNSLLQNGKVTVNVDEFLHVLTHFYEHSAAKKYVEQQDTQFNGYLVNQIELKGTARRTSASLACRMSVDILDFEESVQQEIFQGEERWVCVKLICQAQDIVLKQARLTLRHQEGEEHSEQVSLQQHGAFPSSGTISATVLGPTYYIGMLNRDIVLLCSRAAKYWVELDFSISTGDKHKSNNRQFKLRLPKALKNDFELNIESRRDVQVKVDPSLFTGVAAPVFVKEMQPQQQKDEDNGGSGCYYDYDNDDDDDTNEKDGDLRQSLVTASFPPCSLLSVEWSFQSPQQPSPLLLKEAEDQVEEEKLPTVVTCEQNAVHTIGEGMIASVVLIDYTINHGSITDTEMTFQPFGRPFKVISVLGDGIKRWFVSDDNNDSTKKRLFIEFLYGMEHHYRLEVYTELNMGGTSAMTHPPTVSVQNVTREKGTLAIVAKTFVEIVETSRRYMAKIDQSELPSQTIRLSPYPVLHAFRILERDYMLQLNVTRHDDIEVLCSSITSCNYTINRTENSLQHNISLKLNNTAKQYLRVMLPDPQCDVWSVVVDNSSVAPAKESRQDGSMVVLLIPLTEKASGNRNKTLNITLVLRIPCAKMGSKGKLDFELVCFDAPVQRLNVSLFVPEMYSYGEFEGDLEETLREQQLITYSTKFGRVQDVKNIMAQNIDRVLERGEQMDCLAYQANEELCDVNQNIGGRVAGGLFGEFDKAFEDSSLAGVRSVTLSGTKAVGKQFLFDKYLLMENAKQRISVGYRLDVQPFWKKRSVYINYPRWIAIGKALTRLVVYLICVYIAFAIVWRLLFATK